MSQIDELQGRITTALDRIRTGVGQIEAAGAAPEVEAPVEANTEELDALRSALHEEKLAYAQLKERLKTVNENHAAEIEALKNAQPEVSEAEPDQPASPTDQRWDSEALANLDAAVQRLRATHDALRQSNADLRSALEQGLPDASLINASLQAEIEALKAARDVEMEENSALYRRIKDLVQSSISLNEQTAVGDA